MPALEGFTMFALNQGEVCTCPSRVLVQESIAGRFLERAVARAAKVKQGHPLDTDTMIGAQASTEQLEKILSYLDIGKKEGAQVLLGGERNVLAGDLKDGFYIKPTIFKGHNKMRIFQEEIFGPVVSVTTFKDEADALAIANDTLYGLGAGVWARDGNTAFRMGRGIKAGVRSTRGRDGGRRRPHRAAASQARPLMFHQSRQTPLSRGPADRPSRAAL